MGRVRWGLLPGVASLLLPAAVRAQTHEGGLVPLPRAARAIARGEVLGDSDIVMDSVIDQVRGGAGAVPARVTAGWIARRVIAAGELLRPPAVAPPPVIRAGDTVRVIYRTGPVTVVERGHALAHAAAGERAPVRLDNGQRVEGEAVRPGEVRLP